MSVDGDMILAGRTPTGGIGFNGGDHANSHMTLKIEHRSQFHFQFHHEQLTPAPIKLGLSREKTWQCPDLTGDHDSRTRFALLPERCLTPDFLSHKVAL